MIMIKMLEINTYKNEDDVTYFFTSKTFLVIRSLKKACEVLTIKRKLKFVSKRLVFFD